MDSPSLSQSSYSQPLPPTITLTTHFTQKNYCFLKDLKKKKKKKKTNNPSFISMVAISTSKYWEMLVLDWTGRSQPTSPDW